MLNWLGGPSAKSILCNGLPWIYGWLEEGVQGQSAMKIIQCIGLPEIHAWLMGGPSAKVGSSAKYEHISKFTHASQRSFLWKTNDYDRKLAFSLCADSQLQSDDNWKWWW